MADVLAVGVHVLDVLGRPLSAFPTPGRGQLVDEIRITAAGTAGGTAVDLAKLGVSVTSIGVIGNDDAGDILLGLLRRHGVDVEAIVRTNDAQTSMSMLPIGTDGERMAIHTVGANGLLTPDMVDDALFDAARVLHLGGLDVLAGMHDGAADLLRDARAADVITTLDVLGTAVARAAIDWPSVLTHVDWFLPNEHQLAQLAGDDDPQEGLRWALAQGARGVVVSLGADGCVMAFGDELHHEAARAVETVDTTGCGDALAAGFIAGLLEGLEPTAAIQLGVTAGALVAGGLGSDAGITSMADLRHESERLPIAPPTRDR